MRGGDDTIKNDETRLYFFFFFFRVCVCLFEGGMAES